MPGHAPAYDPGCIMPRRALTLLAALLVLGSVDAHAVAADARGLARFDVGYARCEQLHPQLRGQRDQAYLNLYRAPADPPALARLARLRQTAAYREEHRRFRRESSGPAARPAASPLDHQCRALWAELQRRRPARSP